MSNLNKVLLMVMAREADPELRYTTDGTPVATFRMPPRRHTRTALRASNRKGRMAHHRRMRKLAESPAHTSKREGSSTSREDTVP
jgi:hypothetical protein